ncbi:MAG TPA: GTPase HflX [Candidatus Cloacimonadota bacterium]|nr:GTPase HflX [Candidatus Cloacimonadota bacterium]
MKPDFIEHAFLVGVCDKKNEKVRKQFQDSMDELESLAGTVNVQVVARYSQVLEKPNSKTYIGSGKLKEIKQHLHESDIDTLIFNDNLTPSQAKNISTVTHCNVVDRTELILAIFAQHARTNASKLQVELAQQEYNYSKLRNLWQHLSRIEGGIGMRGPGEKQLEIDRRTVQKRISILKAKLKEIERNELTKRKRREQQYTIAIAGYTNAGKSTLFNRLTKSDVFVADQLFATLDATTRKLRLPDNHDVILTDTIGFIKNLPHTLVSSFYATLMEVVEADLILHVIDFSDYRLKENIESVEEVLKEIKADKTDMIYVFNKWDAVEGVGKKFLRKQMQIKYRNSVFISAKTGENIPDLIQLLMMHRSRMANAITVRIPEEMDKLVAFIMRETDVIDADLDEEAKEYVLQLNANPGILKNIREQVDNYREKKYIMSHD